jgi:hypothetical protein
MNFYRRPWIDPDFGEIQPIWQVYEEMTLASAFAIADNSVKSDHSGESGPRQRRQRLISSLKQLHPAGKMKKFRETP